MRTNRMIVGLLAVTGMLVGGASVAVADGARDRTYTDSFGNLVVDSAAGYRRIIVGKGYQVEQRVDSTGTGDPEVVYLDEGSGDRNYRTGLYCYRPPVFLKGRSYMYGLNDGEFPAEFVGCR